MPDFWRDSGFHLVQRNASGHLVVTDAFLRAYLARPEIRPVPESCDAERVLHAALMADPRQAVSAHRVADVADPDARENYGVLLSFFGHLVAAGTIEAAYLALFRAGAVPVPPLFVDQMVHIVLRNILDEIDDPLRLRAAEALFRAQTVTIQDGAILMADSDTVAMYATTGGFGALGRLLAEGGTKPRRVDLDVLNDENATSYWEKSDKYDTVLDVTFARPGLDALCRVLEAWVGHFLGVRVRIHPVQRIRDQRWRWHVGLDVEASALLNDLYNGTDVPEATLERLLSLFRLEFHDPADMRADLAGAPVYLAMAMTGDRSLRLKPQNLLVNLPLARTA